MSAFQITPFGIVIIAAYSFAIGVIALVLSRLLKSLRWRWWLLAPPALLLMALPWAEEAWIAWHFNEACKEAGVKVYRQVEVEGYLDSTNSYDRQSVTVGPQFNENPTQQAGFEERGFRFLEQSLTDGGARHLERTGDRVMVTINNEPKARYQVKYHYQPTRHRYEEPIGWKLEKLEYQLVDRETGEVLGRDTRITRFPNYMELLWLRYFGPANVRCSGPLNDLEKQKRTGLIYDYVLIPTKLH